MVYVGKNEYRYGRMILHHMAADTLEELHSMAEHIGVRKHFQNKPGKPHYDICKSNKAKAIAAGAIEVEDREIIKLFRRYNNKDYATQME
jgi:predicted alpha/beta superfamily hydrolase